MIITEKLIKEVLPGYSASTARFILGEDCDNGGKLLEDIILSDNKSGDKRYALFSVLGHLLYHDSFTKEDSERIFESLKELRKKSALPAEHGHFVLGGGTVRLSDPYTYFLPASRGSICHVESDETSVVDNGAKDMTFVEGNYNFIHHAHLFSSLVLCSGEGNEINSTGPLSVITITGDRNHVLLAKGGIVNIMGKGNSLVIPYPLRSSFPYYFKACAGTTVCLPNTGKHLVRPHDHPFCSIKADTWYMVDSQGMYSEVDELIVHF